jgi:hypothetical protein
MVSAPRANTVLSVCRGVFTACTGRSAYAAGALHHVYPPVGACRGRRSPRVARDLDVPATVGIACRGVSGGSARLRCSVMTASGHERHLSPRVQTGLATCCRRPTGLGACGHSIRWELIRGFHGPILRVADFASEDVSSAVQG